MITTSYLGSGMNRAFRNKNNSPSHPFPWFPEAVHCIHLEKRNFQLFLHPLPLHTQRGKNCILQNHIVDKHSITSRALATQDSLGVGEDHSLLSRTGGRDGAPKGTTEPSAPIQRWSLPALQSITYVT